MLIVDLNLTENIAHEKYMYLRYVSFFLNKNDFSC